MARHQKIYVTILTVTVHRGSFPIDMLRYDNCVPATERDSGKIGRMLGQLSGDPEDRTVRLRRFSRNHKPDSYARARWESFGCTVVEATEERP